VPWITWRSVDSFHPNSPHSEEVNKCGWGTVGICVNINPAVHTYGIPFQKPANTTAPYRLTESCRAGR